MKTPQPSGRISRAKIALGLMLAGGAWLVWAFDWTWFRPLVQHYVQTHSGRDIQFDRLRIGLTPTHDPIIELRGLLVENAPWAARRPLVRAGVLKFTFAWRNLFDNDIIVKRLDLVDADVDLERQADGLRNWRLAHPQDRGPPRIKVQSVVARNSTVRVLHRGLDLDVTFRISPLAAPQALTSQNPNQPPWPMTQTLAFQATRGGKVFSGQALVSDELTFTGTGRPFALRGRAWIGESHVDAEGTAADIASQAALDLRLRVTARSLADAAPLLPRSGLPGTQPYRIDTHLQKTGGQWRASSLQVTAGHSDLAGEVSFTDQQEADNQGPRLRATLRSARLEIDDLAPLAELKNRPQGSVGASPAKASQGAAPAPAGQASSPRAFQVGGLHNLDAQLDWRVARVTHAARELVDKLRLSAAMQGGLLDVRPLDFGVAGGHATGALRIDGRQAASESSLNLKFVDVQVNRIWPALQVKDRLVGGSLQGRIAVRSRGGSLSALTRGASGSVTLAMTGASVSNRLEAKLGLDGSRMLRSLFSGNERLPVTCAVFALDVRGGVGQTRHLLLETPHVAITGTGSVDLAGESFDAVLTPHRKNHALFALDRSIHLKGSFQNAKATLVPRPPPSASEQDGRHKPQAGAADGHCPAGDPVH